MFEEHAADLVITDIIMPETEGMEIIHWLHDASPNLPIIAISGGSPKGLGSYLATAQQLGASRTLAKPFSGKALIDTVRELLSKAAPTAAQTA
jgi:CheY-like chemotaxis protein